MYQFPIGVILESYRLSRSEAIKKAAAMGAKGIQMYATEGENSPENLSQAARKALRREVEENGLVFSALCGDLGRGFGNKELNLSLIEKSKCIVELAKDLGTDIVTTHIGVVPADKNHDRYKIMQEACFELSRFADSMEAHFAIETGPEKSEVLKAFLDSLGSKGVGVNLDPANLVMVTGDDPVTAVHNLKDYIVHTHAKDGIRLRESNPEYIYNVVHPIPEEFSGIKYFEEVPLGTGSVDFAKYLKALEEIGYRGFLTIEREVGKNPEADIKTAYDFLTKTIAENS
ncbi:MAG: sugar phosphate isomerase/epimerase [Lachnospiraceae bacterium]|nr:sugar phosphate isomerase/epimerase [Lachnospiraceae bacterium]